MKTGENSPQFFNLLNKLFINKKKVLVQPVPS